ncbi:DNA-binding response OmpR family regulator [Rubricella aquisinus]|uniref:DNA-binding response OmpR family regulator n=1 Tax=Rubricella aquisinus TaxID=2028108 RepID=A0A840X0D0_9RHOB|nr:response regulator transcription factor [Rubricella aquisinus]MBB5515355.1 DNA-binding response OmpR family regulator [Rubricella aquisinus]
MTRPKIAVVDDEAGIRDSLVALLSRNQFEGIPAASIAEFRDIQKSVDLDLVLIDLQLQDESGLELAMTIRQTQNTPIVMLTGRGDETDKIVGLELGADDYLLKPFNPRELLARIRAVLRRYGAASSLPEQAQQVKGSQKFGRFTVNHKERVLYDQSGEELALTNAEYRLLEYFLSRPNEVIPRVDLLTELGSDLTRYVDRTVDVLILRLRRKIEENPSKPVHLQTRRGQGYIFVTETGGGGPQ